jgi:hypothetical protein
MTLAIFKRFDGIRNAIAAISGKLSDAEVNELNETLETDIEDLSAAVVKFTTVDQKQASNAFAAFTVSLDHVPTAAQAFAAGAQWAASGMAMSIVSLPADYTPTAELPRQL